VKRSYSHYEPLRRHRRWRRTRLFRTAQLNVVGWLALTGWVIAWSAVFGFMSARWLGTTLVGAISGAVVGLGVLLVVDRRKWGAMETSIGWTDDPEQVEAAARWLAARGIDVRCELPPGHSPQLTYRTRDNRRVMRELGFPRGF
jgi:hypothetical protein